MKLDRFPEPGGASQPVKLSYKFLDGPSPSGSVNHSITPRFPGKYLSFAHPSAILMGV